VLGPVALCRLRLRAWKKGATVEGPRTIQYRIALHCATGATEGAAQNHPEKPPGVPNTYPFGL